MAVLVFFYEIGYAIGSAAREVVYTTKQTVNQLSDWRTYVNLMY